MDVFIELVVLLLTITFISFMCSDRKKKSRRSDAGFSMGSRKAKLMK